MKHALFLVLAFAALPGNVFCQPDTPPTPTELAEIAARGQALAEYDQAAWHAGDAVEALHPARETVQCYVARKTPAGWTVAFGYFDPAHIRFLISYEAKQGASPIEFTVIKHVPPIEDTDFYFHAASALDTAMNDFDSSVNPARPYNISVLPAKTGDWYIYAIPAQQDSAILPFGGDLRYTVSFDGAKILDRRQMHKTVLEQSAPPGGGRPDFYFHTHILSDLPEDSDIFYALTRRTLQGEWVATRKYTYEITPESSLHYLGETGDVAASLGKGDCHSLHANADLCAEKSEGIKLATLSALWRLSDLIPEAWPLQPSASLENARCKNGEIWMTLSVSLRNVGDSDLLLSRAIAGNWIQARFASIPADLLTEKYEKLVFASIDPNLKPANDDSFAPLSPGKTLEISKDLPLIGLDPKGKNVVQLLIYTWFPGDEKPPKQVLDRLGNSGTPYTDMVLTGPLPYRVDPKLLESCRK
jgi:hypothetical protein